MRVMREIKISTDDAIPITISYPSQLTKDEVKDLKDTVAIWLRQLERNTMQQWCQKCIQEVAEKENV
jgi:hypothetical protein